MNKIAEALKSKKIRPTMTRLAVAEIFFESFDHPSAEDLLLKIQKKFSYISRATVYNTLELLAKKGLAKKRAIKSGRFIYDPVISPHHHFVDKISGKIYDIPWDKAKLPEKISIPGFETEDYYLVIIGKKLKEEK
ncbi:MAG: transcriptional repressor [Elusimicrobia bacterium]|nr:transcriptional repressor [Elusimicrobiota bacterium]